MSPSDRPPAERSSATLPTEQVPTIGTVRGGGGATAERIELPEIVPAVVPERRGTSGSASEGTDPTDAWVESADRPVVVAAPAPPSSSPLRVVGRRPRVRKVTRVVRHVDPWSAFKVAVVFAVVLYGVTLTSGVLLWNVASSTGTIDNVERWFTQFGWESFELNGGEIYHNAWIAGLFGAVALTGLAVLFATLFNLVSDIVGGVRVTVLEEEVVERTTSASKRYVVRRLPTDPAAPNGR